MLFLSVYNRRTSGFRITETTAPAEVGSIIEHKFQPLYIVKLKLYVPLHWPHLLRVRLPVSHCFRW
jgi:hypothetical protein